MLPPTQARERRLSTDFKRQLEDRPKLNQHFNALTSTKEIYGENISKVIVLRNVQGRLTQKVFTKPRKVANTTNEYLGVERLDEETRKTRVYVVNPKAKFELYDGIRFDLSDTIQRLNWNWVQYDAFVCENLAEANMKPEALFYIQDDERDNEELVTKSNKLFEAESLVRSWPHATRVNRARLLGHDLSFHSENEVLHYLVEEARGSEAKANAIIETENDRFKSERLQLLRFQDLGIVEVKNGGSYYFDNIRIGADERTTLAYLLQVENRDILEAMQAKFDLMQRPTLAGEQSLPVRGDVQARFGNPVITAPRAGLKPGELSLEMVEQLAPKGYAQLKASQSPAIMAFLQENPNQVLFKQLVDNEMMLNLSAFTQSPLSPPPTSAVVMAAEVLSAPNPQPFVLTPTLDVPEPAHELTPEQQWEEQQGRARAARAAESLAAAVADDLYDGEDEERNTELPEENEALGLTPEVNLAVEGNAQNLVPATVEPSTGAPTLAEVNATKPRGGRKKSTDTPAS